MGHRRHIIGSHHPIPLQYVSLSYAYPFGILSVSLRSANGKTEYELRVNKRKVTNLKIYHLSYRVFQYYQSSPTWSWRMDLATFKKWSAILSHKFITVLNNNTTIGFIYLTTQEIIHWLVNIQYR